MCLDQMSHKESSSLRDKIKEGNLLMVEGLISWKKYTEDVSRTQI